MFDVFLALRPFFLAQNKIGGFDIILPTKSQIKQFITVLCYWNLDRKIVAPRYSCSLSHSIQLPDMVMRMKQPRSVQPSPAHSSMAPVCRFNIMIKVQAGKIFFFGADKQAQYEMKSKSIPGKSREDVPSQIKKEIRKGNMIKHKC